MKEQKQKNRWGIKTAYILEEIDWYEDMDNIGVMI